MIYPLSPAQKSLLETIGEDVNWKAGDDNDFSCYLSQLALGLYMAGDVATAWKLYQIDPMAVYGVTFAAWDSAMKTSVIRHLENEKTMEAHSLAMGNAG
jgi:hypothetical protein